MGWDGVGWGGVGWDGVGSRDAHLEQLLLCERLPNESFDDFKAEMQAVVTKPFGLYAEGHFIIGLPTSEQGLAAVGDQALPDVLPLGTQELQNLECVLQHKCLVNHQARDCAVQ